MFVARTFTNPFSIELNDCNENNEDGVYMTVRRFEQFICSLKKKIDEGNERILFEIQKEENDIAISMLNQLDVSNSVHYFNDTLLKSFTVSIYSFFEHKLNQISLICERHLQLNTQIRNYAKTGKALNSLIEKYNFFLTAEVIPNLINYESKFNTIKKWKELRNLIVHDNSIIRNNEFDITTFSAIRIEDGVIKLHGDIDVLDFLYLVEAYLKIVIDLTNEKYDLINYSST